MRDAASSPPPPIASIARIAGPRAARRNPDAGRKLTTAVRLHRRPCFSFAGVEAVGEEFAHRTLVPVLLFAAHHGHPAGAVDLDPGISDRLHSCFREAGVLLPDLDSHVVLGASDRLAVALKALHRGQGTASQLALALGCSELAAKAQLSVLSRWGLHDAAEPPRTGHLSVAA
jgi:hypothetical protein